jgi:hypothetical protein
MRTRAFVTALLVVLACLASAGGCQVLAGLTVLQITGSTSSTGAGGEGGGGSCAPCDNGKACSDSSECQSTFCFKSGGEGTTGICKATKKLGLECTLDEECGTGYCTDGVCCNVADCGNECQKCAASTGDCKASAGATCGATCGDGEVTAGTCDSKGECAMLMTTKCGSGAGCNPATLKCDGSCSTSSDCASDGFCTVNMQKCAPCGVSPPDPPKCTVGQNGCDVCDGDNTCVTTCPNAGDCEGAGKTIVLKPTAGPARLECNGQCNGVTVMCQGPSPCEVLCNDGSCNGLVLKCGPDGPCKVTCTGTGCVGATGASMMCGDNACEATCTDATTQVKQQCGGSCSCTHAGCK